MRMLIASLAALGALTLEAQAQNAVSSAQSPQILDLQRNREPRSAR
jgi:hypothetical protein